MNTRYIITVGKDQRPGSFVSDEAAYSKAYELSQSTSLPVFVYERGWLTPQYFGRELRCAFKRRDAKIANQKLAS